MKDGPDIARIAALIGDPARANILTALLDGQALTASELAEEAGITPQTVSSHLAKLSEAALVVVQPQGRHRYWRLEGNEVAHLLEALMGLATKAGHVRTRRGPNDPALRKARICYDHLAGDYGVLLFDSLKRKKILTTDKASLTLTPKGLAFFSKLGIDVPSLQQQRRPLCKECLDWSVRRSHLAGALGASLLEHIVTEKWAKKHGASRVINFSASGERLFLSQFCD
jgi:DNA-binding transcriptional ArsR family regulator